MIIKVLPNRIPKIWDLIKFATAKTSGVISNLDALLNDLLHSLLSSKAQCFVRLSENQREVDAVIITKIMLDNMSGEKYLLLQMYYAFKKGSEKDWEESMRLFIDLSKKENCSSISFYTDNSKIAALADIHGFKKSKTGYEYRIKESV